MYALLRSLLFLLDAEQSHRLTFAGLRLLDKWPVPAQPIAGSPREVMGLTFRNPVGLAAGLDKDGIALAALARVGFGFMEIGTVTPRPQPGNDKPRLFRLTGHEALINRMGFNNGGVAALCERLTRIRRRGLLPNTIVGVNIGKNKATPLDAAPNDYTEALRRAYPLADYVAVNLSSPNTPGLRSLQSGDEFIELLTVLKAEQTSLNEQHGRYVPIAVKVSPDLDADDIVRIADGLKRVGVDGVIATNTTVDRESVAGHPLAQQAGGLSGRPLFEKSLKVVAGLVRELDGALPVIAVGGISSTTNAQQMLDIGAELFQIYSSFIYQGPALVRRLAKL